MSVSRPTTQPDSLTIKTEKALEHGAITGLVTTTITYPIDRANLLLQVTPPTSLNIKGSFQNGPFKGLFLAQAQSVMKYSIIFGGKPALKDAFEKMNPGHEYNGIFAGSMCAAFATYAVAPISSVKALRFHGSSVKSTLSLPLKNYFFGVHANAIRDSKFFAIYFALSPYAGKNLLEAGLIGMAASAVCNPAAVISNKQKIAQDGASMFATAKKTLAQQGLKGFYAGFWRTTAPRNFVQGMAIKGGEVLADLILGDESPKNKV